MAKVELRPARPQDVEFVEINHEYDRSDQSICINGHPIEADEVFCGACGVRISPEPEPGPGQIKSKKLKITSKTMLLLAVSVVPIISVVFFIFSVSLPHSKNIQTSTSSTADSTTSIIKKHLDNAPKAKDPKKN
jgi:hypothetical protein